MGAYSYTQRTNINNQPFNQRMIPGNSTFRQSPQRILRPDFRGIVVIGIAPQNGLNDLLSSAATSGLENKTGDILIPGSKILGLVSSSAISEIDSRILDFTRAMKSRVSEGKMPEARLSDLLKQIRGLRDRAEKHILSGDFGAFSEARGLIEGIMSKSEFLSEMYADKIGIQSMRKTIEEANNSGIISNEDYQALSNILTQTVKENAGALMAGDEAGFLASLAELLQMTELTETIRQELGNYKAQAAVNDLSGMNRTAREKIIPGMRSANIINKGSLERNRLIIEFAAKFLYSLRDAQAEILRGTREQIEAIKMSPEISGSGATNLVDAARVIAEVTEQAAVTDLNESSIPSDLWEEVWAKAPEGLLQGYLDKKASIVEEQQRIVEIFAEISGKFDAGPIMIPASSPAMRGQNIGKTREETPKTAHMQTEMGAGQFVLRCLAELIKRQIEARQKALDKYAEERAEEKRAEEKLQMRRHEAKVAEAKRQQKEWLEELMAVRCFILQAMIRINGLSKNQVVMFESLTAMRAAAAQAA